MKTAWLQPVQLAVRSAAGAGLALAAARAIGAAFPIYAMIAAVIVTDLSPRRTRSLALQRIAGTIIGAVLGATLCSLLEPSVVLVAVGIGASMLACHALRMPEAAKLAGYLSGIVLLEHAATPWSYGTERLMETLVGIGVAVALSFVPPLVKPSDAAAPP